MKKIILVTNFLLTLLSCNFAQAFTQMIVFGDSLSDQGYQDQNPVILPPNPYKSPLWTSPNGDGWAAYLASAIGVANPEPNNENPLTNPLTGYVSGLDTGTNYAAGGATSGSVGYGMKDPTTYNAPSMLQQVCQYVTGSRNNLDYTLSTCNGLPVPHNAEPDTLYIIFIGANDVFAGVSTAVTNNIPNNTPQCDAFKYSLYYGNTSNGVVQPGQGLIGNIVAAIELLQSDSATGAPLHILVIGLPDVGATPLGRFVFSLDQFDGNHCLVADIGQSVGDLNTDEAVAIQNLRGSNPLYQHVSFVDVYTFVDRMTQVQATSFAPVSFPGVPGLIPGGYFTENRAPACINGAAPTPANIEAEEPALTCIPTIDYTHYMFEDAVHPTDTFDRDFASEFYLHIQGLGWLS